MPSADRTDFSTVLHARRETLMGLRIQQWNRLATRLGVASAMALVLLATGAVTSEVDAGSPQDGDPPPKAKFAPEKGKGEAPPKVKLGLSINEPGAFRGYTV